MTVSRAESLATQYGRRRSNTATSVLRSPAPAPFPSLKIGDSKVLNSWVHETKESKAVIFNQAWWPGVEEGDMLRVTASTEMKDEKQQDDGGFLFIVPKDEVCPKPQLQVDAEQCSVDYVEFIFQDQYLGRNDMWRLGDHLVGQCIYTNQEITFIGAISIKIHAIYIAGKKVRLVVCSQEAGLTVTIFIQVCRELWEFAGDGERYNEKIVHSFLPALFSRWRAAGTNHTVTVMLISRVFYDADEIDYAAGPLRRDERGTWYKDFYKLITDLEVMHTHDWKPILVRLKADFWAFQRDILLTHHYHLGTPDGQVRLVGHLSAAHDGPILEAINLGLNPTETHYIDRSLSLTGSATILITPGTGYFRVSKRLLRLTTTRMLDQGFGLDLVSLAKPPLHQSPIFSFEGLEPETKGLGVFAEGVKGHARASDPLWGGNDDSAEWGTREKKTFWWEPFWITTSFWDKQMDLPIRDDRWAFQWISVNEVDLTLLCFRFVARAKMYEIQMLGLLDHDVLSSIEVPFLPDYIDPSMTPQKDSFTFDNGTPSREEANKADMDIFAISKSSRPGHLNRYSFTSSSQGSGTVVGSSSYRSAVDKRANVTHRNSIVSTRIGPIEESPRRIITELPDEGPSTDVSRPVSIMNRTPTVTVTQLSTSPSQASIHTIRSSRSSLLTASREDDRRDGSTASRSSSSKFPTWLFSAFRSGPVEPQTTQVSASAVSSTPSTPKAVSPSRPVLLPAPPKVTTGQTSPLARSPAPMNIKGKAIASGRTPLSRTFEEETTVPHRGSYTRHSNSPVGTPPRESTTFGKRHSTLSTLSIPIASSSPTNAMLNPSARSNPSRPQGSVSYTQAALARRWQHMFPQPAFKHEIKWRSMVTPGCLPLTVEHFPTIAELDSSYDVFSYDFVIDPPEMRSFMVKAPALLPASNKDEIRREWALCVMRGMVAVRLVQGFQFILRPPNEKGVEVEEHPGLLRRTMSYSMVDDEMTPKPVGAAQILRTTEEPVYLSMSNEIHRISYTGEAIQVKRYVRRMPPTLPFEYQCLIWPKLGVGYTELKTEFTSHGLENYGWNRLDMLVAGYERQFNESLRYWRTRFVVIPTAEPPQTNIGPSGEELNDEETRLLGIDKLADIFSKLRWQPPEERNIILPPVRFLPTTLSPSASVMDESLLSQLDEIHAAGPLRKKMRSERDINDMSLSAIAKAMREEDGVPIKNYQWHNAKYPDSFTGYDLVSWLVREFRDVGSRVQGADWGAKLQEQGLFDHCRGTHGFLDGLMGEYAVPVTPKGWFRSSRFGEDKPSIATSGATKLGPSSPRRNKRRIILSQSMVIDIDPSKKSDQAESIILHHDIIHNPANVFHFELQWIGTTARCIEDQLRQWSRTIEVYGLKLVEAYVTQISDIRERNAFQSCFPIRLSLPPPVIPDLDKRIPEGMQARHFFEYALLIRFGFILDIEAGDLYSEAVDVVYSYRRSSFRYSQFVHRSGVAFVQVVGGPHGFLFLTNRLVGPGRVGTTSASKDREPAASAEEIRVKLNDFCENPESLREFYEQQVALLGTAPEEPPPLSI
ncbi:hypothetical protein HWV62_26386 [Athelia sp. TMB]|nr:hypothetical protein HWV62_26386 [Athelia sp. TMB]